jgi:hypothetical protein
MKILSRYTNACIWESDCATIKETVIAAIKARVNLSGSNLIGSDLSYSDLSYSNLSYSNLCGSNLSYSNLSYSDLSYSDLSYSNLRGSNLSCSVGISRQLSTSLLFLFDQPGKIRLYKIVTGDGVGPFNGGITYVVGESYSVANADSNANEPCGAGINVATLDWCLREWREGYRVLVVEFEAKDIACIPTATDGKLRLHRCTVVGEKTREELGLEIQPARVAEEGAK